MKKIFFVSTIVILFSIVEISCIDRDTIAGTGKEIPDRIINIGGTLQIGQVTDKLPDPLVVRVVAANGRPVKGVYVEFYVEDQNASLSDSNKITDGDGYAQTYVTLGTKADSIYVYASVLGLKGSPVKFSLYASVSSSGTDPKPTKPWMKIHNGNNQSGTVGTKLSNPLTVQVLDLFDNPVPKMMMHFSTTNGSLSSDSVLTDVRGLAATYWTLDTTIGSQTAKAVCHEILGGTVQFNATGVALLVPKYFTKLCSDTFYTLQGLTINKILHVNVADQYGNPVYSPGIPGFRVHFFVTEGFGSVDDATTDENGDAFAGVTLAPNDSIMNITGDVGYNVPKLKFTFFAYKYFQLDSLRSTGGAVTLFWQKNMNLHFGNYTIQRCTDFSFGGNTVDVKVITDENNISTVDATAVVGSTYVYRIKVNYTNGYNFYTNMREVKVNP